ncbi:hypothetical protein IFM47457_02091 [Aspergillus lentulus]|nr:hypothetical protein IFM47457_02091 [Aspergillus lentulus]
MTVDVYLDLLIQELISLVGVLSATVCIISHVRFTPTFSEVSYTAITDWVVKSRSEKPIEAVLEVKRNFRYAKGQEKIRMQETAEVARPKE